MPGLRTENLQDIELAEETDEAEAERAKILRAPTLTMGMTGSTDSLQDPDLAAPSPRRLVLSPAGTPGSVPPKSEAVVVKSSQSQITLPDTVLEAVAQATVALEAVPQSLPDRQPSQPGTPLLNTEDVVPENADATGDTPDRNETPPAVQQTPGDSIQTHPSLPSGGPASDAKAQGSTKRVLEGDMYSDGTYWKLLA